MKIDADGILKWGKRYLFTCYDEEDHTIRELPDGGFILVTSDDAHDGTGHIYPSLFRINKEGDSLWTRMIPDFFNEYAFDIHIAADHGFIVAGTRFISKTDSEGNHEWSISADAICNLEILPDGTVVALGSMWTDTSTVYVSLTKYDASGGLMWKKIFASDYGYVDASNLCTTDNNGFALTYNINGKCFLVRTDGSGNKISQTQIAGIKPLGLQYYQGLLYYYALEFDKTSKSSYLLFKLLN